MKIRISIAVAAALIASQGFAADKKEKPEAPKRFCHMEAQTGTIIRRRVCRTQAEIDAGAERAQYYMRVTRDDITGTNRGLQDR